MVEITDEWADELRLSAKMIRKWAPETFPANENGQFHFARAMMESVAETIEKALSAAISDETGAPVAWQWRALASGEPKTAWKGPNEGDRPGWEALAQRNPDAYSIEKRLLYLHPTPAHSGEREALEQAARRLVDSEFAKKVRNLVAGWNGEGVPEEYRMGRHDDAFGVKLQTNCGAVYMLDEVLTELRAALDGKPHQ